MTRGDRPTDLAQTGVAPESAAIVVTDIAGSMGFSVRFGDLATRQVIHRFFTMAEQLVQIYGGRTVKLLGDDGAMILFTETEQAFAFATALQRSLVENPIVAGDEPMRVRVSLHAGSIRVRQTSYGEDAFGVDIDIAARLNSLAQPGEIVVSATAAGALSEERRRILGPPERVILKGHLAPIEVNRVDVQQL